MKALFDALLTIIENSSNVSRDLDVVHQIPYKTERKRKLYCVINHRLLTPAGKLMRMAPATIRPFDLNINEAEWWVPALNPGQPSNWHPVNS